MIFMKNKSLSKSIFFYLKKDYNLYLMILPGLIWFLLFCYWPMYGVLAAFKDYSLFKGLAASPWVGLKYFIQFFNDPYCFRIIRNTFLLSIYLMLWSFPAPILLAISLNEVKNKAFRRISQSVSYLPYFISTVVLVGILQNLTADNGILNIFSKMIFGQTIDFFLRPEWFRTLYISSSIWQYAGWYSIIYLAALTGIDPGLYESSVIDGANRIQQIFHISLPGIRPVITITFIMSMGSLFSIGFEKAYLMSNPTIYETADIIATYVFRRGITEANYGYATAIGLFNSVVSLVLLLAVNSICSKLGETTLF